MVIAATTDEASSAPVTATKADSFVDSIGVNVHMGYDDTVYGNYDAVKARLLEIGIRHTRDGFENPGFKQYIKDRHNDLGRSGVRGTFMAGGGLSPAQCLESAALVSDSLEAFEGQNEILNIYVGWDDAKRQAARQYQIDYFDAINASSRWQNYPILGPTAVGTNAYVALGDLSAYMDYGNFHPYPLGPAPAVSNSNFFGELAAANNVSPGKQLFATETGYTTGTADDGNQRVSPNAAGKYAPRLYLENYNRGVLRSFWYELLDQGTNGSQEASFGLFKNNFDYKPQGTALRNLITLLKDATFNPTTRAWEWPAFTPGILDYTLSGNTTNVHTTLLQKSNGKFYLCLWQEVNSYDINNSVEADINNPNVNVTLTVAPGVASAVSYLPTNGTTGTTLTVTNGQMALSVPDQVLIVELTLTSGAILSNDIGSPGVAGSAYSDGTTFTVTGGGADIWGTSDQFHYVSDPATGDGTLIARITGMSGNDPWAKAGVMLRDSLAADSKFVFMAATPANGVNLQWRATTGGPCGGLQIAGVARPTTAQPVWVKLVKTGPAYTGSYSLNGTTWTALGTTNVTFSNATFRFGLAVTSHNNATSNQVTFTNVSYVGSIPGIGLFGDYFNNVSLSGAPALTRTDATVDFDWVSGSPAAGITVDNFSARWSGQVQATVAGNYTFSTYSDDGVRLWVNEALIINNWTDHGPIFDTSTTVTLAAGQRLDLDMEFYERGGGAVAKLYWTPPGGTRQIIPQSQLFPPRNGLTGDYYNNTTLSGTPARKRLDANVAFDWGTGSPDGAIQADNFSARWTGQVQATVGGNYTFTTTSDDGVRLWVNGVQVINNWTDHSPTSDSSVGISMAAGQRMDIQMEYYEKAGGAVAKLLWTPPGGSQEIIPQTQLWR